MLALARELSDPLRQTFALVDAAILHLFRREHPAALEGAESCMAMAHEHGFLGLLGFAACIRAHASIFLGQLDQGIAGMRAGMDAFRAAGHEWGNSHHLVALAHALGNVGQVDEGLAVAAEAEAFVARTGERFAEAEVFRVKGDLLLAHPTPDPARAEAAFREALEVASRQSARSWELRATTSLARLLRDEGRRDEARALLQPIYDWFTEGFDTPDLKDAKALLGEL
jgi:predicted ATPase